MFYLYLQSSSASRQPKISNLIFFANPVYRVQSIQALDTLKLFNDTARHGPQRTSYFSLKYTNFLRKYSTFICNPQALLESEKIRTLSVSPTLNTEYEEIQAWHLENFLRTLPDTVFELLNVWQSDIFPYFSLKQKQFLLESILSLFRIL